MPACPPLCFQSSLPALLSMTQREIDAARATFSLLQEEVSKYLEGLSPDDASRAIPTYFSFAHVLMDECNDNLPFFPVRLFAGLAKV